MAKPIKIWDGSQWVDVAINVPSITGHADDTTNIHGITDTANLVYANDSRLTDSRTPTAHATSHESGGTDEIEIAQSQVTNLTTDLSNKIDKTVVDAKGDLLVGSADNTVAKQSVGNDGQGLVADSSATNGVRYIDPPTNRNLIINGSMLIAARGTNFSFGTGSGAIRYAADRFNTEDYRWSAGSNITISNDTTVVPTGFGASYKVATGATGLTFDSGGTLFVRTRIEGYNIQPHYSKTLTLSFWVRSSVPGTYNLFLENGIWGAGTTTRAFTPEYTINAANTWEKKSITIDMASATSSGTWNTTNGMGLGISWMLGGHSDRTGNSYKSGWTNYSSIHIQTSTGTQWATNANATFFLAGVQLEASPVATPFEFEPYETTLRKCQRYYQQSLATGTVGIGSAYGSANALISFTFEKTMRTAPTITIQSPGNLPGQVAFLNSFGNFPSTIGTHVAQEVTENRFRIVGSGYTSAFTPGDSTIFYTNTTNAIVYQASAEL